jgi:hypothetical protein
MPCGRCSDRPLGEPPMVTMTGGSGYIDAGCSTNFRFKVAP